MKPSSNAAALALSLAACGDKPPAETATAKIESAAGMPGVKSVKDELKIVRGS